MYVCLCVRPEIKSYCDGWKEGELIQILRNAHMETHYGSRDYDVMEEQSAVVSMVGGSEWKSDLGPVNINERRQGRPMCKSLSTKFRQGKDVSFLSVILSLQSADEYFIVK